MFGYNRSQQRREGSGVPARRPSLESLHTSPARLHEFARNCTKFEEPEFPPTHFNTCPNCMPTVASASSPVASPSLLVVSMSVSGRFRSLCPPRFHDADHHNPLSIKHICTAMPFANPKNSFSPPLYL